MQIAPITYSIYACIIATLKECLYMCMCNYLISQSYGSSYDYGQGLEVKMVNKFDLSDFDCGSFFGVYAQCS